jgi:hypothetical protein
MVPGAILGSLEKKEGDLPVGGKIAFFMIAS